MSTKIGLASSIPSLVRYLRERELYLPQHEYNAQLKIEIKCQVARTGKSPTSWPPCENKQTNTRYTKSKQYT